MAHVGGGESLTVVVQFLTCCQEEMLLEGELRVTDGQHQLAVNLVSLEVRPTYHTSVFLYHLIPMTNHNEWQSQVHGNPARTLHKVFHSLRVFLLGILHTACRPGVQGIAQVLARDFTHG